MAPSPVLLLVLYVEGCWQPFENGGTGAGHSPAPAIAQAEDCWQGGAGWKWQIRRLEKASKGCNLGKQ